MSGLVIVSLINTCISYDILFNLQDLILSIVFQTEDTYITFT